MQKNILEIEIHEKEPERFCPHVQVSACYLQIDHKLLLLQRTTDKSEPGKWGVPAGKIENNETPFNAAIRELFEETGIRIDPLTQIRSLGVLYMRKPEMDFVYHCFKVQIDHLPSIHLSDEHQSYTWASAEDLKNMPLMAGAEQALRHYQKMILNNQTGPSVNLQREAE